MTVRQSLIGVGMATFCLVAVENVQAVGLMIVVNDIELEPDTDQQVAMLYLQNSGPSIDVAGLELNFQIGDGGSELGAFGGSVDAPSIQSVDLMDQSVFSGQTVHANTVHNYSQLWVESLHLDSGTVAVPPVADLSLPFAKISFDSTGFFDSSTPWELDLMETLNGATSFFDSQGNTVPVTVSSANLTIAAVPEPGAFALVMAVGLLGYGAWRRRVDS